MCCLGCCTARGRVAKSVVRPLDKMPLSFSYSGYSAICPVPAHRFKHIAPNDFFSAKLSPIPRFVRFCSDRRAFDAHLRQCLLGIQRYLQFDASPQRFLGRIMMAPASSVVCSASALGDGGPAPLREALCLSSHQSSSLPSLSW